MNRYRIQYNDMWCLASYDCLAETPEEAVAKANKYFDTRFNKGFGGSPTTWFRGGNPVAQTMEEINLYMNKVFGEGSNVPWYEGRNHYSIS